jgi:hypothetical protein
MNWPRLSSPATPSHAAETLDHEGGWSMNPIKSGLFFGKCSISLFDMIQFFMEERHMLTILSTIVDRIRILQKETPTTPVDEIIRLELQGALPSIQRTCSKLKMAASVHELWAFEIRLRTKDQIKTYDSLGTFIEALLTTMSHEFDALRFAYIHQQKWEFFEQDGLFGDDVSQKFPSAAPEIKSAGNCLAVDLNTAAIFHLMRATEVGLRALASELGVVTVGKNKPIEFAMWGEIISYIQSNMSSLVQGSSPQEKKEKSQFYNGVLLQCEALKELWRNPVSHSGRIYSDNEAIGVYTHVKEFFGCLATRVKEAP